LSCQGKPTFFNGRLRRHIGSITTHSHERGGGDKLIWFPAGLVSMIKRNMQRDSRLFLKHELPALVLFWLAPLAFGCVKLKTLDCASSKEGCTDQRLDAKLADSSLPSPDGYVEEPADAPADLVADRMDAALDSSRDIANLPDAGGLPADVALPDTAGDLPVQDAAPPDVPGREDGVPDAGRADTVDAKVPDTALPDARTPDLPPLPDVGATYTVTFNAGVAKGAMTGYGWVTMGVLDPVTSPTCGPNKDAISNASPCVSTSTNWDSSNALCVSGTAPALPPSPTSQDYSDNWGIQLGANASDPLGAIGKTYSTITLNFTGTPQTGLRATVHRTGDPIGTTYCSLVTSGTPMALTSFNTSCWNGSGTNLTAADLPKIDKVGLEVPSTQSEITLSKLCLTGIVFGI
jgi:hypothetical protein